MSTASNPIAGLHLVRYGTAADQKFLLGEFLDTYDQIVINATMLAHMPAAIASFLTQRAHNKPYFIDPQTHAFQHDVSHLESTSDKRAGEIKRSIRTLIEAYGEPVKSVVGERHTSILPEDLSDREERLGFCERVLRFQIEAIAKETRKSDAAEYYSFLERTRGVAFGSFQPTLAVAPYFYMAANTFDEWLEVNLACAQDCIALAPGTPLGVQVVISKDVLVDPKMRPRLIERYRQTVKPDVFLVWVDAFSEQNASASQIEAFVELLKGLNEVAPVVNLYGGFLSVALSRCGVVKKLVGVVHGLEYGEVRGVLPVGGGIPVAKFYFPALHHRLAFREALRAVRQAGGMESVAAFHSEVCDCKECRSVISSNPKVDFEEYGKTRPMSFLRKNQPIVMEYPLTQTKEHSVKHYMWCKAKEYRGTIDRGAVVDELKRSSKAFEPVLGLERVAHCRVWQRVLSGT